MAGGRIDPLFQHGPDLDLSSVNDGKKTLGSIPDKFSNIHGRHSDVAATIKLADYKSDIFVPFSGRAELSLRVGMFPNLSKV